jgi:hypothetical protein
MGVALGITVTAGDYRRVLFTEMPIAQQALKTLATGRGPIKNDRIAYLYMGDAVPDCSDNARPFMAHYQGLPPEQRIMIGVAEARRFDRDQYFIFKGFVNDDFPHLKTSFAICYGCTAPFAHTFENKKFAIRGFLKDTKFDLFLHTLRRRTTVK